MIQFGCEHCGQEITAGDGMAGRTGRCPKCRRVVTVPAGASGAPGARNDNADEPIRLRREKAAAEDVRPRNEEIRSATPIPARSEPADVPAKCPRCGGLGHPGARICLKCGLILTGEREKEEKQTENELLSGIGAAAGLSAAAIAIWVVLAGLIGAGPAVFMGFAAAAAPGPAIRRFVTNRGAVTGALAVVMGILAVAAGKYFVARLVISRDFTPRDSRFIDEWFERVKDVPVSDEQVRRAAANEDVMFSIVLLQLAEEGEIEREAAEKFIMAHYTNRIPSDIKQGYRGARERVEECLTGWDEQKKGEAVRKQLLNTYKLLALADQQRKAMAWNLFAAFFASFDLPDVILLPAGLAAACMVASGRRLARTQAAS